MNQNLFNINMDLKEQRQALIFGVCVAFIGFFLYSNQVLQNSRIHGGEYFSSLFFALPCLYLGFISGLIFFVNKNITGLFLPFIVFIIHAYLFGDMRGDDLDEAFINILCLILSTLIAFVFYFLIGLVIKFVNEGK